MDEMDGPIDCFIDLLIHWLIGWLIDWLIDQFIYWQNRLKQLNRCDMNDMQAKNRNYDA